MHDAPRLKLLVLWLFLGALAVAACSTYWPAAHLGNESIPVGMDSFYHARRILDTAAEPSAFYEFDKHIHAPEGSLLTWPWGYDYAMGWIVRLAGEMGVPGEPIAFLVWIPVAAVIIPVGLIILLARRLSLSLWSAGLAGACVALSPLTTFLNGVGNIDHHYVEYIFVLATLVCGLTWFSRPHSSRAAVILGVVLGIAPAVHNGLFILQVPVLATIFLLWVQGIRLPRHQVLLFCAALLVATCSILAPSLPVRLGRFEFYTLSWFHLYIAVGTISLSLLLSWLTRTPRNIGLLAIAGAILLIPMAHQILIAHSFLTGTIKRLDAISEMYSLRRMLAGPGGPTRGSTLYSGTIWLLPFIFAYCAWQGWVERHTGRLFFWLSSVMGLVLLTMQFRLHYFGSFALFLPLLIFVENQVTKAPARRRQFMLLASLGLLLMYAYPVRHFLLGAPPLPASDPEFGNLRPILETLKKACAEDPGIVLADNDAGHYIRYYTECSVIANNFLLTPQHEAKIEQIDHLTSLSPEAMIAAAPYVRYVLVRPVAIGRIAPNNFSYMTYSPKSAALIDRLLLKPPSELPANYVLLNQANLKDVRTNESIPYIRLYKVLPSQPQADLPSQLHVGQ